MRSIRDRTTFLLSLSLGSLSNAIITFDPYLESSLSESSVVILTFKFFHQYLSCSNNNAFDFKLTTQSQLLRRYILVQNNLIRNYKPTLSC